MSGGEWGCDETRFYFEWGLLVRVGVSGGQWGLLVKPVFQPNRLAKSQTKAICFDFCSSGCSAVDDPGDFVLILQPQPAMALLPSV